MINKVNNDVKRTVRCMIVGAVFYNVFVLIGAIVFSILYKPDIIYLLKNILVVVIGSMMCVLGIYSLYKSVLHVVDEAIEKRARAYMIFNYIVRIVVFCVVLIFIMKFIGLASGIIFVISVFGIKIGAYLAPLIKDKI